MITQALKEIAELDLLKLHSQKLEDMSSEVVTTSNMVRKQFPLLPHQPGGECKACCTSYWIEVQIDPQLQHTLTLLITYLFSNINILTTQSCSKPLQI